MSIEDFKIVFLHIWIKQLYYTEPSCCEILDPYIALSTLLRYVWVILSDHVVISSPKNCVREQLTYYKLDDLFRLKKKLTIKSSTKYVHFLFRKGQRTLDLMIGNLFPFINTNKPGVVCQQNDLL